MNGQYVFTWVTQCEVGAPYSHLRSSYEANSQDYLAVADGVHEVLGGP